jgi:phosphoenolpyruvate-protein phosphotransferase (PTS system enzyme I)
MDSTMPEPTVLQGVGAAAGVAVGQAVVVRLRAHDVRYRIGPGDVDAEQVRLAQACDRARGQLERIRARAREVLGSDMAAMFDAQLLMLDDPLLRERAQALIGARHLNADWAVLEAGAELTQRLRAVEDTYLRERHGDLTDVLERIRANLQGQSPDAAWLAEQLARFAEPCVLVADDLPVSVAVQLEWRHLAACVTEAGTRTAHTAILARSVGLPAVVGVANATHTVPPGALVLVDGERGAVTISPDQARVAAIGSRHASPRHKSPRVSGPALTADGVPIALFANVERPDDVPFALREGAAGLGLVRSELLMGGVALGDATEELQCDVYSTLLDAAGPEAEVTIRTFDMTPEDAGLAVPPDTDPRERLGMRALRFSLVHPALFDRQARALLRAGTRGQLRIMFPFVTQVAEIDQARARIDAVAASLGVPVPPIGTMVEVPAAALDAARIAEHSAFLSVGTNDLIQYTLAADRNDGRVSHLYDPLHPAVLRLLRAVARAARRVGRRVSVCGEMAGEPALLAVLIGFGFREFSMAAGSLRAARDTIAAISVDDARAAARQAVAGRHVSSMVPVGE